MKNSMKRMTGLGMVALLAVLFASCSHTSQSTAPAEPQPNPKAYFVGEASFTEGAGANIYSYELGTQRLDSFRVAAIINGDASDLEALPDGSRLFYTSIPARKPLVINTKTKKVEKELMYLSDELELSPDGRWLAILGNTGLQIISTSTYEVVFKATGTEAFSASFLSDNSAFYCLHAPSTFGASSASETGGVSVLRVLTSDWSYKYTLVPGISDIVEIEVMDMGRRYALYTGWLHSAITIYDLASHSVVHHHQFAPGAGSMCYSQKRNELYFSAPGTLQDILPNGSISIHIASFANDEMQIDSVQMPYVIGDWDFMPQFFELIDDHDQLLVTGFWSERAMIFSLESRKIENIVVTGGLLGPPTISFEE